MGIEKTDTRFDPVLRSIEEVEPPPRATDTVAAVAEKLDTEALLPTTDGVDAHPLPGRLLPKNDFLPDPFVWKLKSEMRMVGTTNEHPDSFTYYHSRDKGRTWSPMHDSTGAQRSVFPRGKWPTWINREMPDRWAPEIHRIDGKWVALYTARAHDGRLKIGMATARDSRGPWLDKGPIVEHPTMGVIDATFVKDPKTGKNVLVWKVDGNAIGAPTPLMAQAFTLHSAGATFEGQPHELMTNAPHDGGLVEGQFFVTENDKTYLFYSSDCYADARYRTSVVEVHDLLHGEVASTPVPLIATGHPLLGDAWVGPGHPSLVRERPGLYGMYLHVWPKEAVGKGAEARTPIKLSVSFRDAQGKPTAPHIVS